MTNVSHLLALHSIDGLGPIRLRAVLEYFKDPKLAWEANEGELLKIGIFKNTVNLLLETRKNLKPETYAEEIAASGIKWITIFDESYPRLLREIYDPPVVVYYKGKLDDLGQKAIAVVGTRKMTGYGKVVTEEFTKGLVNAGLTVISGLARGVDSQAHLTAVSENGRTIAVLGGGLNNIFPPENRSLAAKIASDFGAVISEFPPTYPSLPGNFPARNRIISGLSLAVVVIEAAEDSGSLITARLALEQGREVFAVPGPITSDLSKGPINLIKEGARIVFSPDEVLEELGMSKVQSAKFKVQSEDLSEEERQVLGVLENENRHIDEIGRQLNFPSPKISALLLKMEISGLVQSMGAGIYCKK
ncbi:DNA protecting protein DprA [Candidatus Daviesbacteria bacterium RIFCSPHIGHO2_01_FULL_40_11]|uniref:DNA protecting protein DprA n=1 Tax=Candidatus Daviesbacteria bacterium RIFCSPHIGHO2_01_FULL_40_11 TaxID=1797762 RepID=A0A1F5JFV5_9BACT|nr:MAG: DNA protecting protein DprA [Candidatus Daviesbacteria bacterium RIFCSPHIGHO2_01_FULL_40_11]OGE62715.1 MAG: DNA protecting protein DprA [Candidatus Daviesbacteria bacterium RIFCSPLOWO2_01_FULL_40_27]